MSLERSFFGALAVAFAIGGAACGTQGQGDEPAASDEGALVTYPTSDPRLVGTWITDGADTRTFYSIQFRKNGTFDAIGGCPAASAPQCFTQGEQSGTWTVDTSPETPMGGSLRLLLVDESGQTTTYYYQEFGNKLALRDKAVPGAASAFDKQPTGVIAPGKACTQGSHCTKDHECRSNCPDGAECVVALETCQPKVARIKANKVCVPDHDTCVAGHSCRDNCPSGAHCFVSIFTCQAD